MIAHQFIKQDYPINKVLLAVGLAAGSYYYKRSQGRKGNKPSTVTFTNKGVVVPNNYLIEQIEELLREEFVDYGYIKVTWWLRREHDYIINFKKVYRLMKENNLLLKPIARNKANKKWITDIVPQPKKSFEHLEFDIKYIYIHGARRNALLLSIIDVKSRWLLGWSLKWSIKMEEVIGLFNAVINDYTLPEIVTVRSDNGSQFESHLVRKFLADNNIIQEFTRPATPQQNGHIEAYHSILERTLCQRIEFESLNHAYDVFKRFDYFYNQKRIHSGIDYYSPLKFLTLQGIDMNKDFSLRGWRLETTANKQDFGEYSGAHSAAPDSLCSFSKTEKEFPTKAEFLKNEIVEYDYRL